MQGRISLQIIILVGVLLIQGCKTGSLEGNSTIDTRVDSLLALMNTDEKIGQLSLYTSDWTVTGPSMSNNYIELIRQGKVGAIFNAYTVDYVASLQKIAVEETRLGIPLLFGYDVIHGHRTIFPIPLAQACSWDPEKIIKSERIAATEATAEGINWTFAPMVDISRDPRWGRVMEGAGEDTYLGSIIAASRVKGFQGSDLGEKNTLLACVKHFAAYGAPQAGRDYYTVDMSLRSLYEWYLPPYRAAVDEGVGSVMTSFNEIAGVPSSSNHWLLTDLLRHDWGFRGFVVSDYTSINELIPHGVASDSSHAGQLAFNAGLDMDMQGSIYANYLEGLLASGKVNSETLDNAVRHILKAKFQLGLFDDPFFYCNKQREKEEIMTPENLAFARDFAASTFVLLKNDNNTLPIKGNVRTIAVIGPLADSKADMLGSWSAAGQADKCVTLLDGIKARAANNIKVIYAKGCDVAGSRTDSFRQAMKAAREADFIILALGENSGLSGEAASRTDISLPGLQIELAQKIIETGIPTAVVLFNGRPLILEELDEIAPAILETWFGGTQAGNAIADVLFGDKNPSGKLTMTFPRNIGQIPIFYNGKNSGRPFNPALPSDKYKSRYIDSPNTPLYPFGYGLSYTTYDYSEISLNKESFTDGDTIIASVEITNNGTVDGDEIVQLYVHDRVGDVTRPLKELKGFKKITIRKGEKVKVSFSLMPGDLSYYHQDMTFTFDPGEFELYISHNSTDENYVVFTIR